MRNKEVASELELTEGTVKVWLHRIYEKLGVNNRTELALMVRDQNAD
jgi:two-component system nitrate/nitrite response regulator NarP